MTKCNTKEKIMSLSTHIKNLLNTQNDSQLLSVRLPSVLINQLDELAQSLDKSRSDLIATFILGGVDELEKQLATNLQNITVYEPETDVKASTPRYFLLNTNYNNCEEDHFTMLETGEASAFYGHWKENIAHLRENDVVFLYQSGYGICGYGIADKTLIKREHYGAANEWYARKLHNFVRIKSPIPAKTCKEITKENINFRLTMVSLGQRKGKAILDYLNQNPTHS